MTKPSSTEIERFVRERDEALRSGDEGRIRTFCTNYGIKVPDDAAIFEAGVRKARAALGQ